MELSHAYATEDELREHLGDQTQRRIPAGQVVRALNAASRAIDQHTGLRQYGLGFWSDVTPATRTFETVDANELLVPPIATPDTITITTAGTNWVTTDYLLYPLDGAVRTVIRTAGLTGTKRFPTNDVTTVLTRWGYLECPDEVNEACLLKAASLFARKDAPFGVATFGDFAAVRITRRDPDVIELLNDFCLDIAMVG